MKNSEERNYKPSIIKTALRFSVIIAWFGVMLFASSQGLFVHAFLGILFIVVLAYLTLQQVNARSRYLKKRRSQLISNYYVGEEYLKVFAASK